MLVVAQLWDDGTTDTLADDLSRILENATTGQFMSVVLSLRNQPGYYRVHSFGKRSDSPAPPDFLAFEQTRSTPAHTAHNLASSAKPFRR